MANIVRKLIGKKFFYVLACDHCNKEKASRKDGNTFLCEKCYEAEREKAKAIALMQKKDKKKFEQFVKLVREELKKDNELLIAAIRCLWRFQTETEKKHKDSVELNGVGFNKPDARALSWAAVQIERGHSLFDWRINDARRRVPKYAKQIARAMIVSARKSEIKEKFRIAVPEIWPGA